MTGSRCSKVGSLRQFVKQTADFMKEFHQQMERTKAFAQSLNQLGLLSEVKATVGQIGSSPISLGKAGWWMNTNC